MALTKIQGNALASSFVYNSTVTNLGSVTNAGNSNFTGVATFDNLTYVNDSTIEKANVIASTSGANITVALSDSAGIVYYTDNTTSNVTVNFTGMSGIATGNVVSSVVILTNNTNPKYISTVQVDGSQVTAKWSGGAPTSGTANVEVYAFNIIKTGSSSYTVLGQKTNFQ